MRKTRNKGTKMRFQSRMTLSKEPNLRGDRGAIIDNKQIDDLLAVGLDSIGEGSFARSRLGVDIQAIAIDQEAHRLQLAPGSGDHEGVDAAGVAGEDVEAVGLGQVNEEGDGGVLAGLSGQQQRGIAAKVELVDVGAVVEDEALQHGDAAALGRAQQGRAPVAVAQLQPPRPQHPQPQVDQVHVPVVRCEMDCVGPFFLFGHQRWRHEWLPFFDPHAFQILSYLSCVVFFDDLHPVF